VEHFNCGYVVGLLVVVAKTRQLPVVTVEVK